MTPSTPLRQNRDFPFFANLVTTAESSDNLDRLGHGFAVNRRYKIRTIKEMRIDEYVFPVRPGHETCVFEASLAPIEVN